MDRSFAARLWLCAVLAVLALFCAWSVVSGILPGAEAAGAGEELAAAPAMAAEGAFILRAWDGYVGVFTAGADSPLTLTDIELSTLRRSDRALLEQGVSVGGYEELLMLLEDYGS